MEKDSVLMEKIISLAKRRGFIYQGSDIYGGLAGTWDYGHLGVALKNNIKGLWWKKFVDDRRDMYGIDAAILMHPGVWKASGHVDTFTDPLVECTKCKKRFRADQLEKAGICDSCGAPTGEARNFNMMFQTQVGAVEDSSATVYLRPETAQGMFVNFKNVVDSFHPKLPFGTAQIGKAFRNEITPRDFIFRVREFEQMEIEYFIRENDWEKQFEYWKDEMIEWMDIVGIDQSKVHELEVEKEDLAHYSRRTVDFEFDFPFGRKELYGLAYRTNFDLNIHKLEYVDEENASKMTPHVIEPSFGLDRTVLAVLLSAYNEEEKEEDTRVFLKLKPSVAPVICAVSPLLKNKPELVGKAEEIFGTLKKEFGRVMWDDNGNIGKRYRRQDEIGTPWCIVIDFDTLTDNTVTIRDRDTGSQIRLKDSELVGYIKDKLN
jgi:glycyl-tRNA synthetase